MVALRERDVIVNGPLEDPAVAGDLPPLLPPTFLSLCRSFVIYTPLSQVTHLTNPLPSLSFVHNIYEYPLTYRNT